MSVSRDPQKRTRAIEARDRRFIGFVCTTMCASIIGGGLWIWLDYILSAGANAADVSGLIAPFLFVGLSMLPLFLAVWIIPSQWVFRWTCNA